MKFRALLAATLATLSLAAAVPPAPQLFPQDTIFLVTVPDWTASRTRLQAAPYGRLWSDPAMRSFREDFEKKVVQRFIGDMEKDLGIEVEEYLPLLQGQLSVAVIQGDWNPADPASEPGTVLVLDARDKADQLRAKLVEARQKLTDAKKTVKTDRIRDVEFTTVVIEPKPAAGDDEEEAPAGPPAKIELSFGQVDSALVFGNSLKALEKLVARLTGGSVPALAEVNEFRTSENTAGFRDSLGYAWVHLAPVFGALEGQLAGSAGMLQSLGVDPRQAIAALGLRGLKSLALSYREAAEGGTTTFSLAVPESERGGVFQLLALESKDSAPPAFVPADAVKFQRWRLNGAKTWTTLENLLQKASPQLAGLLQLSLSALGKDRDPNFDLRRSLIGNLGDDFISYAKAPRGNSPAELANPPSLTLLGAVNAEQLAQALRTASGALGASPDDAKEREFNGRKILRMTMPATDPRQRPTVLEMAPSGGYLALSDTPAVLEEYLRSAEGGTRSLRETAGLADASQRVGGFGTGLFGYDDQRESLRATWEALRSGGLNSVVPTAGRDPGKGAEDDFADFKLLPAFGQVAKYFGMSVYAGAWNPQGFLLRQFNPPPK